MNPLRIPGPPVVCRTLTGRRRDSHPARQPQAVSQAMRQAVAAAGRSVVEPSAGFEPAPICSGVLWLRALLVLRRMVSPALARLKWAALSLLSYDGIIEAARAPCGQALGRTRCGGCVYRVAFPALPMVLRYHRFCSYVDDVPCQKTGWTIVQNCQNRKRECLPKSRPADENHPR